MPSKDGWWLLRELRASQTPSANIPVLAVSGERHDRPDPTSGFAGYFVKPVDLDRLVGRSRRCRVIAADPARASGLFICEQIPLFAHR
jgi:DNA-binding response OmpR family regulator